MAPKKPARQLIRPHRALRLACRSAAPAIPAVPLQEVASRERGLGVYLGAGMPLPNPDPVLKRMGKDITAYQDLLTDSHIGGCADSRAAGVLSLDWSVDQGKEPSRAASFCADMLAALPMHDIIRDILSAPLFGYTILEITWHLGADNKLRAVKVEKKPRHWFVYDGQSELLFRSKQNPVGETLPPRKFLQARHRADWENPYGEAVMSRVFWPGAFKKGGFKFWAVFVEKYGMPHITGKTPRGTGDAEVNDLLYKLENMVQDAIAVIPDDCSVEIKDFAASGASVDAYERFLLYCEKAVSVALIGQTLTTDVGDKGSYAAAKTHMQVRGDIVAGDKKVVEQTIQQLLNWTCELNFPGEPVPVFGLYAPGDVDLPKAERDETLSRCGVRYKKTYFQREYGLQEDDFDLVDPSAALAGGAPPFAGKSSLEKVAGWIDKRGYYAPEQFAAALAANDPVLAAADKLSPEELQRQLDGVLKPVLAAVKSGSYQDIEDGLIAAYPDMDSAEFQETLARALFVSEIWARLNAPKA